MIILKLRMLKMRVNYFIVLMLCALCSSSNGVSNNTLIGGSSEDNNARPLKVPVVSYDQQISGFDNIEDHQIQSGPIVLVDKRTLFISDLQYKSLGEKLTFWVGNNVGNSTISKYFVTEEKFVANHSNLYIKLPDNVSLDDVNYVGVGVNGKENEWLVTASISSKVNKTAIRKFQEENTSRRIFRIPKCCKQDEYFERPSCVTKKEDIKFDIDIFESNETGLDPEVKLNASDYELRPYIRNLVCDGQKYFLPQGEASGFIFNSSVIVQSDGIKSHGEFCTDLSNESGVLTTITVLCYEETENTLDKPVYVAYLTVLVVSMICLAVTATAFGVVLKAKDIYRKCFIIFCVALCVEYFSLLILQVQGNDVACNIFGSVFVFFLYFSFTWLCLLCFELFYLVGDPLEKQRKNQRWYWYNRVAFSIAVLLLMISVFSGELGVPDVPSSFIKAYGTNNCSQFLLTDVLRCTIIVFVPMLLLILSSIGLLIGMNYMINRNERDSKIRNHCDWFTNRNSYKFLFRTYLIIVAVASIWLFKMLLSIIKLENNKTELTFDFLEAILGFVILIGFVCNKYTWRELKEALWPNQRTTTDMDLQFRSPLNGNGHVSGSVDDR